jgi:prolyl-tRNA editing enzyme YbaK/EbsC (Cys-tRNA(Pro) deacylase)
MIYTATLRTPSNRQITVAVDTTPQDSTVDLNTVAHQATRMAVGMYRLHDVKRTTRKMIAGFEPVKNCTANGRQWGWVQY